MRFTIIIILIGAVLWLTGILSVRHRGPTLMEEHKSLSDVRDFVGTLWQTSGGKSIIYFASPDSLVYSFFNPDIYTDQGKRRLRTNCPFRYDQQFKVFTIPRLGMQFNVSLKLNLDSLQKQVYLDDLENFQRWQQETSGGLLDKAK